MITTEASTLISKPPAQVFAFIDDLGNTPRWNTRCVEVKQTSPGPRAVGSKLHYRYQEPGRQGTMDGEMVRYEPGRELAMRYSDKALDVSVEFSLKESGGQTELVHRAAIETRGLLMKLMTPMIRSATRKQTDQIVARLKELIEKA